MAGSSAFVLPSTPTPHFVETFGIVLVESMLAGGGPIITTTTGGIPEAVGDTATFVPVDDPDAIAVAIDDVVLVAGPAERAARAAEARSHAMRFDRLRVFDQLLERTLVRS